MERSLCNTRVDHFQSLILLFCVAWKMQEEQLLNPMVIRLLLVISILYISSSLHNMLCACADFSADMYSDCNESEQTEENSLFLRKNYAKDDCEAEQTVVDTSTYSKLNADMPADCNADCKFNGGSSCFFRDVSLSDLKATNLQLIIPVLLQINMHLLSMKWIVCKYLLAYITFMHLCYLRHCLFIPQLKKIQYKERNDKLQFDVINDTHQTVSLSKKSEHGKPQLTCQVITDSSIDLSTLRNKQHSEVKDDEKRNLRQNTALPDSQNSNYYHEITVAIGGQGHNNPNNESLQRSSGGLQNQQTTNNELFRIDSDGEYLSATSREGIDIVTDTPESQPLNVRKDLKKTNDAEDCMVQKHSSENLYSPPADADGAWGGAPRSALLCTEESCAPNQHKSLPPSLESAPLESSNQENELQYSNQAQVPEPLHEVFPTPAVDDSDIQRFEPMMAIIDKIAIGERVPPQITMRYEMLRFCTLRSFPKENKPFITRIAQAGFYYANTRDEVVCYCCAKRKSDWLETDVPLEVHRQLNPNCRFLNHNNEVNVSVKKQEQLAQRRSLSAPGLSSPANNPLIAATAAAQTSEASRQRNIGQSNRFSASINNHSSTALSRTQTSTMLSQPTTTLSASHGSSQSRPLIAVDRPHGNFSALSVASVLSPTHTQSVGINSMASTVTTTTTTTTVSSTNSQAATVRPPKYPAYATQAQRDASFRDCSELVVPANSLAEAGFFYAGFGDCCRCFQCGVGLRHWSAEDDPWIEHSRWSKNCAFVKEKKGEEFVNLVQMAVEYQQNQQSQQQQQQNTTGTGAVVGSGNDVEQLLHTDAAQSVLEMGYSAAIIQRAIRECINTNGGTEFTAAMLMEKIFAFEESSAPPRTVPPAANPPVSSRVSTAHNAALSEPQGSGDAASRGFSRHTASAEGAGASLTSSQPNTPDNHSSKRSQLREQKKLKEENEKLKQQSICTQCKQNGVSIVFLPCGHLVTCEQCAEKVRYCTERNCGKYIKGTVRTYVA